MFSVDYKMEVIWMAPKVPRAHGAPQQRQHQKMCLHIWEHRPLCKSPAITCTLLQKQGRLSSLPSVLRAPLERILSPGVDHTNPNILKGTKHVSGTNFSWVFLQFLQEGHVPVDFRIRRAQNNNNNSMDWAIQPAPFSWTSRKHLIRSHTLN